MKIVFAGFCVLLFGCSTSNKHVFSGVVETNVMFYSHQFDSAFIIKSKIWYKDSATIQEIVKTEYNTDTNNIQTKKQYILKYLYIDRNKKIFREYEHFSDTSKLLRQYTQTDSDYVPGGYRYYNVPYIDYIDTPVILKDTNIQSVTYRRIKYKRMNGKYLYYSICYFRDDKPESTFKIFNTEMEIWRMVKIFDYYLPDSTRLGYSMEINFLKNGLSKKEESLFKAWEKN